eukprot:3486109-Pyramimonas_sp.AAC.1
MDIWIAAVDFEKAFDSVSHKGLWEALRAQQVPEQYVRVLSRLCAGQTAQARSDCNSRVYRLELSLIHI